MFFFFPFPTFFLRPPQLFSHLPCPAMAPSHFATLYRRRESLRGHEFLGRFFRVYAIEGEFFAHTDLCITHSLSLAISSARFHHSAWLPSLLPTCIRPHSTFVDGCSE